MRQGLRAVVSAITLCIPLSVLIHAQQTADEIVARVIQAKGGAEKLKSVQSMKVTGTLLAQGVSAPFTIWSKRPNMARQQTVRDGQAMVRAFDGSKAWMMIGPDAQELAGPQSQMTQDQAEFDSPLLDYKAKGHTIEFVGTETIGGSKVYHLKLTSKNGFVQQYFVDAETGLEKRTSVALDQGGQSVTLVTDLSDYRDVAGLKVPFSVKQSANGTPVTALTIDKVEVNAPIDDAIFKMPRKP
jgi:outer membrane lipoprotein-sorting protein